MLWSRTGLLNAVDLVHLYPHPHHPHHPRPEQVSDKWSSQSSRNHWHLTKTSGNQGNHSELDRLEESWSLWPLVKPSRPMGLLDIIGNERKLLCMAWHGMTWHDMAWHGMTVSVCRSREASSSLTKNQSWVPRTRPNANWHGNSIYSYLSRFDKVW